MVQKKDKQYNENKIKYHTINIMCARIKKVIILSILLSLLPHKTYASVNDAQIVLKRKDIVKITTKTNSLNNTTCIFVETRYWDCGTSFDSGLYSGIHLYTAFGYRKVSIRIYDNKKLKSLPPKLETPYESKVDFTVTPSENPDVSKANPTAFWSRLSIYKSQIIELHTSGKQEATLCLFKNGVKQECSRMTSGSRSYLYESLRDKYGEGLLTYRTYVNSSNINWQTKYMSSTSLNVHPSNKKPPIPEHLIPRKVKGNKAPIVVTKNAVVSANSTSKHYFKVNDPEGDKYYVTPSKPASGLSVIYEDAILKINVWDNITGNYAQYVQVIDDKGSESIVKFNIKVLPEKADKPMIRVTLVCNKSGQLQIEQKLIVTRKPSHEGYLLYKDSKAIERLPINEKSETLVTTTLRHDGKYYLKAMGKEELLSPATKVTITPNALLKQSNRSVRCEKATAEYQT